jgi:hypothetical protein
LYASERNDPLLKGRLAMIVGGFRVTVAGIAALTLIATPQVLSAATASQQATVQGLVGTWSCVSHTSDNKTYRATDVDTMYGKWLRVSSTYPAQNGSPAGTEQAFFGYDAKNSRWIIAGVSTSGDYYVNYSNSPSFNGSQWYDGYPNMHGSAVVRMTESTQFTVDSKGMGPQGKTITRHEVCTRQ